MLSRPAFPKSIIPYVTDSSSLMTQPLLIISIGAVTIGYLTHELFLSYGSTFYFNSIFFHPESNSSLLDAPFSESSLAYIPLVFLFLLSIQLFISNDNISAVNTKPSIQYIKSAQLKGEISSRGNHILISDNELGSSTNKFTNTLTTKNHFNIYNHWIKHNTLILSNYLYRYIDKGFLELFGPLGCQRFLHYLGFSIELLSTGFIPHYALIKVSSLILGLLGLVLALKNQSNFVVILFILLMCL